MDHWPDLDIGTLDILAGAPSSGASDLSINCLVGSRRKLERSGTGR